MDSRVVYLPAMQNSQDSDEREKSLLILSSDSHMFLVIFYYHVVQVSGEEADRIREDSKLRISAPVVLETLHWP